MQWYFLIEKVHVKQLSNTDASFKFPYFWYFCGPKEDIMEKLFL